MIGRDGLHPKSEAYPVIVKIWTVLVLAGIAAACGGGSGPAVAPTPVVPNPPSISCPVDIAVVSAVGRLPAVSFDTPATQDGQSPVNVVCTPASGAEFQIGRTPVNCEATDALSRQASCSFTVTVAPPPKLQRTKFLAFGDSITEGKNGLMGTGVIVPGNYAERLRALLADRYREQAITMVNEGQGGESTGEGKWRLGPVMSQAQPEVLLLLEGTNDLIGGQDTPTIDSAVDSLQTMVRQGKARGALVLIATLPPMNPGVCCLAGAAAAVPALNARIRSMAAAESVSVVDLEAVITLSHISGDGKHLNAQGNQVMANAFYTVIVSTLEVKTASLSGAP